MKAQIFFLLALFAIMAIQCCAMTVDDAAFPPNVFTYNATRCDRCHRVCTIKFDRQHLVERKTCITKCDSLEICTHYSPVQLKPEPVKVHRLTALEKANCTGLIPSPPVKEYVGAETKTDSPQEFFQNLKKYVAWRTKQDRPSKYQDPEFKTDIVLEAAPAVCVECMRGPQKIDLITPDFEDRRLKVKVVIPATPITPTPSTPVESIPEGVDAPPIVY